MLVDRPRVDIRIGAVEPIRYGSRRATSQEKRAGTYLSWYSTEKPVVGICPGAELSKHMAAVTTVPMPESDMSAAPAVEKKVYMIAKRPITYSYANRTDVDTEEVIVIGT